MTLSKWDFDYAHSSVDFTIRHMLVSKVRGRFAKWTGNLQIDEDDYTASSFDVSIDVTSIDTNEPQRDGHLRSGDFFEVEKFPHMTFTSKRVERRDERDEHLVVTGDLSLRGVTQEVVLQVERGGIVPKDPWGKRRAGFVATTKINRKDFGLTFNQTLDHGGLALGEEVSITLEIEATQAG